MILFGIEYFFFLNTLISSTDNNVLNTIYVSLKDSYVMSNPQRFNKKKKLTIDLSIMIDQMLCVRYHSIKYQRLRR